MKEWMDGRMKEWMKWMVRMGNRMFYVLKESVKQDKTNEWIGERDIYEQTNEINSENEKWINENMDITQEEYFVIPELNLLVATTRKTVIIP